MNKFRLNAEDILNKVFSADFKGYSCQEVDQFLDMVLLDYEKLDEVLLTLKNENDALKFEIANLKAKNIELEGEKKYNNVQSNQSFSNVDILKRLSRLEEKIYNNN